MAVPSSSQPLVGVFDSGVGGLSVLKALHRLWPAADLLYVADSGHAPYGERSDDFILERTQRIASHLLARGAAMLVLACNTATAVAAADLRKRWLQLKLVAVEPGLKPAVAMSRNARVGVMATSATVRSEKFNRLLDAHRQQAYIHVQPCPGLAGLIEQGSMDNPALLKLIMQLCQPLKDADVDTVVLGCTHYAFAQEPIQRALGADVRLIDTADAVAQQAIRLLKSTQPMAASQSSPCVKLETTGDVQQLRRLAKHWLPFDCEVTQAVGL